MIDNFMEYMWYLLITPQKKLKKALNKWYIFCKVFGRRFDEVKEDIQRARDEGMVATCSQEMLPLHAADRGLTRYPGEHPENFRSRIAMYEEVCRLGGLNEGILKAVRSLGYKNLRIECAAAFKHNPERWAEFYLIIIMKVDEEHPIGFDVLRKVVRQWKEVGGKDNYYIEYCCSCNSKMQSVFLSAKYRLPVNYFNNVKVYGTGQTYCFEIHHEYRTGAVWHEKHNLYFLDGAWMLDGTRLLDAYQNREEL